MSTDKFIDPKTPVPICAICGLFVFPCDSIWVTSMSTDKFIHPKSSVAICTILGISQSSL